MNRPTRSRRAPAAAILLVVAGVVATLLTACDPVPTEGPGDGKSADTAGVSCWGIKQVYTASTSGTYWLLTPAMARPAQFSCDMETDGGGWVLVGRGREGWTFQPTGQGSASQVRTSVSGSAAFAPAALPSATITELMNGSAVNALSDGVRVERTTNTAGTTRQEVRLFLKQTRWNWTFHAGQLLTKISIDGTTYQGSNTRDTYASVPGQTTNGLANKQGTSRMFTWPWASNSNKQGFSFGSGAPTGSTSATSNLWQASASTYAIPFTRVWVRPRLANTTTFSAIPAAGYTAAPLPAGLSDRSEVAPWGVSGREHAGEPVVEPYNTNVLAVEATPDRVFVGGRFTGVQQGPTGTPISRPRLAAFDLDGNWISTFTPTVNGRVWDMVVTSDNKLIIAGDFTSVNGAANTAGMAALDPTTGAVISGWKANVSRVGGTEWRVRSLDLRGSWIYAAGLFDRVVAGTSTTATTVSNAMSVATSNGALGTWRPTPNGSVVDIAVTNDATRVLLAGYFGTVGGSTNHANFSITNLSNGALTGGIGTWTPSSPEGATYQQAVADLGDRLLVGGSQHSTQVWNKARSTMLDSTITMPGGDTQVIEIIGSKAFFGCHCGGWALIGAKSYDTQTGFRSIEPINLVAAFDTATWSYDTSWYPGSLKGDSGEGIWAIDSDANSCLWVGGDLNKGAYTGVAATDWLGGFARFCPMDVTVPAAPGTVKVTSTGTSRKITWTASTDSGGGSPTYDVVRNGKVIASLNASSRSYTDPDAPAGTKYTVRAADARGNRSATAAPITVA